MRILIIACLCVFALSAHANCVRPTETAPAVPDGANSDEATMKAAHNALQAYVNLLEAYQACLKRQVDEAPSETPDALKHTWMLQGDAAIDSAQNLASAYSAALKAFKARPAAAAK